MTLGAPQPVTVGELMTVDVVTVSMDDTLEEVRSIFDVSFFHHLVVVESRRVVGVVSDRDLLRHLSPFIGKMAERATDAASLKKRVHQVMTRELISVRPDTVADDAGMLMLANRVSCLPVLHSDGSCAGIVTIRDICWWAL